MEIAKLVLEYWKASVWPLVFVIAVLVFRDQIRDALRRARSIDAMGVNVELAEQVEEAQEALAEAQEEIAHDLSPRAQTPPGEAAIAAHRALKRIAEVRRDYPSRNENRSRVGVDVAMRATISLLTEACLIVAEEFGSSTFDVNFTSRLSDETGLSGWRAVVDTTILLRRFTRREGDGVEQGWVVEGQPPAPHKLSLGEMFKAMHVAEGALNILEDLLARAAQTVVEQAEESGAQ